MIIIFHVLIDSIENKRALFLHGKLINCKGEEKLSLSEKFSEVTLEELFAFVEKILLKSPKTPSSIGIAIQVKR